MDQLTLLRSYFVKLGMPVAVADIYVALHTYGPQTISDLARNSGMQRITIYRLLDELKASGLVEIEPQYKRNLIRAAPITNLQLLITQKEQELRELQNSYPAVSKAFLHQATTAASTRVHFYEGVEGLRQMVWNQTKAKGENLAILYDTIQYPRRDNFTFFERWVTECNRKNVNFRGIVGSHFIGSQQRWYQNHTNERLKNWNPRYIDEKIFPIAYSMVIYNDVVLYYDWGEEKILGIEIYNKKIANMQRQLFEMLWQQAVPVDDLVGPKKRVSKSESPSNPLHATYAKRWQP